MGRSGNSCAVAICRSPKGVSYHRIPKNPELRRIWVAACHRKGPFNIDTAKVCSNHFTESDYHRDLRNELLNLPVRKILKANAIPTLNLLPPDFTSEEIVIDSISNEKTNSDLNVSSQTSIISSSVHERHVRTPVRTSLVESHTPRKRVASRKSTRKPKKIKPVDSYEGTELDQVIDEFTEAASEEERESHQDPKLSRPATLGSSNSVHYSERVAFSLSKDDLLAENKFLLERIYEMEKIIRRQSSELERLRKVNKSLKAVNTSC